MTSKTIALPDDRNIILVYQAGIANVFHTPDLGLSAKDQTGQWADRRRIYQGDFRTAENIAYGLGLGGRTVRTFACNMAGDIALQPWTDDLDAQPFSEKFRPQVWN